MAHVHAHLLADYFCSRRGYFSMTFHVYGIVKSESGVAETGTDQGSWESSGCGGKKMGSSLFSVGYLA
jgi:hypothetical protein